MVYLNRNAMSASLQIKHSPYYSSLYILNNIALVDHILVELDQAYDNLLLEVSFTPDFLKPMRWKLGNLPSGTHTAKGICGAHSDKLFEGLQTAMLGQGHVRLLQFGQELAQKTFTFTWLPHNAWGGCAQRPELLAAFVCPDDAAIDHLLEDGLKRQRAFLIGPATPSWSGYDKASSYAIENQAHVLWDAMLALNLQGRICSQDASTALQRLRTPSQILKKGSASSLDVATCYAAALAKANFRPLIVMMPRHILVGVKLNERGLSAPIVQNPEELSSGILMLEATMMERSSSPLPLMLDYSQAKKIGSNLLKNHKKQDPILALDILQLWERGISPLPLDENELGDDEDLELPDVRAPFEPDARNLPQEDSSPAPSGGTLGAGVPGITIEPMEEDEEGIGGTGNINEGPTKMEFWRSRLLDLTLHNPLLNFHHEGSAISLFIPDSATIERELNNSKGFTICNVPEELHLSAPLHQAMSHVEALRLDLQARATEMLRQKKLIALSKEADSTTKPLRKKLLNLYRQARKDLAESSSNTLYLACGFLKWYEEDVPGKEARFAPLLLLPVRLKRASRRADFTLSAGETEPIINLTLLEKLKADFSISIPELEGELPQTKNGINLAEIMNLVRTAVQPLAGWEVIDFCALGNFSFVKYLMWRDLRDREKYLMQSKLVSHLATNTITAFPAQVDFPSAATLDDETRAAEIFTPLSADSSQLAAILAAERGKTFVLSGPPGTGKSQTIANMIAHCLGRGKRVLFVAEKSAALSVVYKKLRSVGLHTFCLELHSNKANKRSVLAQFADTMERLNDAATPTNWELETATLELRRRQLNELPKALHQSYPDTKSLYSDLGYMASCRGYSVFTPCEADWLNMNAAQSQQLLECARTLKRCLSPVREQVRKGGLHFNLGSYTPEWEEQLASTLQRHVDLLQDWEDQGLALTLELGKKAEEILPHISELEAILRTAYAHGGMDLTPLLPGQAAQSLALLQEELTLANLYRYHRESLSVPYSDRVLNHKRLEECLSKWKEAERAPSGITRSLVLRALTKELKSLTLSPRDPNAQSDLEHLAAMSDISDSMQDSLNSSSVLAFCRKGLDMTEAALEEARQVAQDLQGVSQLLPLARTLLNSSPGAAAPPSYTLMRILNDLCETQAEIRSQEGTLSSLMGQTAPAFHGQVAELRDWAHALLVAQKQWRALCIWAEQAEKARQNGYGNLVDALLSPRLSDAELDAFDEVVEWNFRRLRTATAINESEELRLFTREGQEHLRNDFRAQDELVLSTTALELYNRLMERAQEVHTNGNLSRELAILRHATSAESKAPAIRALLDSIPNVAPLLKPCMLMSPLSVAQYLGTGLRPFDIVIFDEASQIPVWDAIGAIGRGRSTVIVGDPQQMPPTNFFQRSDDLLETDGNDLPSLDSILKECHACSIPLMRLSWHYRSRSESLIAFSNKNYYDGKLITFPAPLTRDEALEYHYVRGTYDAGHTRTNEAEAEALVNHVIATLKAPGLHGKKKSSIGIVTFNIAQQELISEKLEKRCAEDESLDEFFSDSEDSEAIFVKNLESVQGDERDCIYFSTTFGPDREGNIALNFGPLNKEGGERRLNVAITRARTAMHVFSSLRPEDINLDNTKAQGVADLRHFLECAQGGVEKYLNRTQPAGEVEKNKRNLTEAIAARLREKGWKCRLNVGASNFRLDIAVEQPELPGAMLAAIMLDGPTYRAANTARDRDLLRDGVLEHLGWRLIHVWALEWHHDPDACLRRIEERLATFCAESQPESLD